MPQGGRGSASKQKNPEKGGPKGGAREGQGTAAMIKKTKKTRQVRKKQKKNATGQQKNKKNATGQKQKSEEQAH
jgi:hypothetical protein